jgi:hypothetical protein
VEQEQDLHRAVSVARRGRPRPMRRCFSHDLTGAASIPRRPCISAESTGSAAKRRRDTRIDRLLSFAATTIVGVIAAGAIIRFVMPPLSDAANSLASSGDSINADFQHVITVSAISMPDGTSVEVWAKNVGSDDIADVQLTNVEFGRESNTLPVAYGGAGCSAPCWWYELDGAGWAPGETVTLHIELSEATEAGGLYRARVSGHRGGQASATVRAP